MNLQTRSHVVFIARLFKAFDRWPMIAFSDNATGREALFFSDKYQTTIDPTLLHIETHKKMPGSELGRQ